MAVDNHYIRTWVTLNSTTSYCDPYSYRRSKYDLGQCTDQTEPEGWWKPDGWKKPEGWKPEGWQKPEGWKPEGWWKMESIQIQKD